MTGTKWRWFPPVERVCSVAAFCGGKLESTASLPPFVYAPVEAGTEAGKVRCLDGEGKILCELPLRFGEDVPLDESQRLSFREKLRWAWLYACRHSAGYPQYVFY